MNTKIENISKIDFLNNWSAEYLIFSAFNIKIMSWLVDLNIISKLMKYQTDATQIDGGLFCK